MKYIYIASPYTGNEDDNAIFQLNVADRLVNLGYEPFWPLHMHYWHLIIPHDYEYWMERCLAWISKCDALLRLGGKSEGADREVTYAISRNIPVFYGIYQLENYHG